MHALTHNNHMCDDGHMIRNENRVPNDIPSRPQAVQEHDIPGMPKRPYCEGLPALPIPSGELISSIKPTTAVYY